MITNLQVASVVGRAEVVSCIFFILALLAYSRSVSVGFGSTLASLHRTRWPLVALSILLSACAMLSKEQGVMVIGVCVSYDVFIHWEEVWTGIFDILRSGKKLGKLKDDTDEVLSSHAKAASQGALNSTSCQASPTNGTNGNTNLNGMTTRLCNGGSKGKSVSAMKADIKEECNTSTKSKAVLTAVIIRTGSV